MKLVLVQPQLSAASDADNITTIRRHIDASGAALTSDDIVVLPEGVDRRASGYERDVAELARTLGCHVVGGSRRERVGTGLVNAGLAFNPAGAVIGRYEKLRPYADERRAVQPGEVLGELSIGGRNILVLVCADFWFADLIQRSARLPDLIVVASLSVTRKATPTYSRSLWRHLAVARAYEFGVYVGISDWGHPSGLPSGFPCGVGGFADPTGIDPEQFFTATGDQPVAVHELDFGALDRFREDRSRRGFFWKPTVLADEETKS